MYNSVLSITIGLGIQLCAVNEVRHGKDTGRNRGLHERSRKVGLLVAHCFAVLINTMGEKIHLEVPKALF